MAGIWADSYSPYGIACIRCNDHLIAPDWSRYMSERHVRHSWSCESCGLSQLIEWFSTAVSAPDVKSKLTVQALYPNPKCGDEFRVHIRHQLDLYTRLIHEVGIKSEYN